MEEGKRARTEGEETPPDVSAFFRPFRVVGQVTNSVKAAVHYNGGVASLTTCIGQSFHIYDVETLNILFVGPTFVSPIKCLAAQGEHTFTATEEGLCLLDRARKETEVHFDLGASPIMIEVFGDLLLALFPTRLYCYTADNLKYLHAVDFGSGPHATHFVHPATYLNKVVVAFADGSYQLWNIKSQRLIHAFKSIGSPILCVEQTTATDVLAFGLDSMDVVLMDIRCNREVLRFKQPSRPTSISFQSGVNATALMSVALENGHVVIWDLDKKQVLYSWEAHQAPVSMSHFIRGQPILVTCAGDNSIKEWTIDNSGAHFLKGRSGHSKEPSMIRFYDEDGTSILSASHDKSLRLVSLVKDSQSSELSQGSIESISKRANLKSEDIKLDPIIAFDSFVTRDLKWDNVVTAHFKSNVARTWRADHKRIGSHELRSQDKCFITAVSMSACGNFSLLGTEKGSIDVFNIQSGIHRKHFNGIKSSIVGLFMDASNQTIVAAYQSAHVELYDMISGRLIHQAKIPNPAYRAAFHPDSGLLALAVEDNSLVVFDIENHQIVRCFVGHEGLITDICFSADGRWMLSSSADNSVRCWDLATGVQLDQLKTPRKPLTLSLSPTMDMLAVAFEGDVGIHLFTNMSMYSSVAIKAPDVASNTSFIAKDLTDGLIELSLEPRVKSINLLHLESIRARNRPVLPQKPIEKAPFFLDAMLTGQNDKKRDAKGAKLIVSTGTTEPTSESKIVPWIVSKNSEGLFAELKKMSTTDIDFEIKSLVSPGEQGSGLLYDFIELTMKRILKKTDYEFSMTVLNVIFKSHYAIIAQNPSTFAPLFENFGEVHAVWVHLEDLYHHAICLTEFCRQR